MSEDVIQQCLRQMQADAGTIGMLCPRCAEQDWTWYGLPGKDGQPGLGDYICDCCGFTHPGHPYKVRKQPRGQRDDQPPVTDTLNERIVPNE